MLIAWLKGLLPRISTLLDRALTHMPFLPLCIAILFVLAQFNVMYKPGTIGWDILLNVMKHIPICAFTNVDLDVPCDVCHKAKQTNEIAVQ